MEKWIFVFLVICNNHLQAQPIPGSVILKGSSSLSGQFMTNNYNMGSGSTTKIKSTHYNFQPSVGAFFSHFVTMGVYVGYNYQNDKGDDTYDKLKTFSIGPYLRCYLSDSKFAPFLHTSVGLSSYKVDQKLNPYDDPTSLGMSGFNYLLGAGVEYFVNRKFSFEFLLDYTRTYVSKETTSSYMGLSSSDKVSIENKGLEFRIGVSVFLN